MNGTMTVLFYLFGAAALASALACVTTKKLLRSAVALMGALVATAGAYALVGSAFLAGIQLLVYVGGIVVLLVFAILLTHSSELVENAPSLPRRAAALAVALGFVGVTGFVVLGELPSGRFIAAPPVDEVKKLGRALLDPGATGYVAPFELISALLLAVIIGALVIARDSSPLHARGKK